ncbi:MAG TPA: DUF1835 domain-containing protein [Candidatus Polarisedimenticolaceae bacterium]|nr:DUF1835 domain-containing protein [Candidatus Polarisedimenticolaceae bacterium]
MDGGWLHVVCGDAAAASLRASGVCAPEAIRIQHDVLSVGPLLPFADLPSWIETRLRFWRTEVWAEAPAFDAMPLDLIASAQELAGASGVVLWVAGGLSHQLLLPSTARLGELAGAPALPLAVGELGSTTSFPLNFKARVVLPAVWERITAPDPERLLDAIDLAEGVSPELHRALGFFLTRYPDIRTGLARWDEELLRHAPGTSAELVGRALRANEAWLDPVGDRALLARLRGLADPGLARPTLAPRGEDLVLTGFGEDVLAGRKNFVDHNGIDTWVAGVHLDVSQGRVWFREGAGLVRAEA